METYILRPQLGQPTLLVYRECICGNWCATGEGASAPICSLCGTRMMPGGTGHYGEDRETSSKRRRDRCLGFVGLFTSEQQAMQMISRLRKFIGLGSVGGKVDVALRRTWENPSRYYAEEEVALGLQAIGKPAERQWEPEEIAEGGEYEGGPPFEKPVEVE